MTTPQRGLFVREATGLVKNLSWFDLFFYSFVTFGGLWSIIYATEYAPLYGGNPVFSLILTTPGVLALLGVYYIFQTMMPRSGGDYVFNSRLLHPAIGFAANFAGWTFFYWFWIGDAAAVFTTQGLAQMLNVYGSLTNQPWALSSANIFTPVMIFLIGTIAIIGFTLLVIFSSQKYFRIQNVLMSIDVLAILIIAIILLLMKPVSFQAAFNEYATKMGVSNAYAQLTKAGMAYWGGPTPTGLFSGYTFLLIPLWYTVLFWVFGSNYLGGELRNTASNAKKALFCSFLLALISLTMVLGLAYVKLGPSFLTGAGYYALGYAPNPLPVLPNIALFAGIASGNYLISLIIGLGVVFGFLLVIPWGLIGASRVFFAYAFDRLAPLSLADVNQRWHSPVKSILIAALGGEVFLVFLSGVIGPATSSYAFLLYSYAALAAIGFLFPFTAISAILLPFFRKQIYEQACPVKRKIIGVPVVTWLGMVALIYCAITMFYYSYDYQFYFGAGTLAASTYFPFLIGVSVMFVACVGYYYIVRNRSAKRGFPIDKIFAEIPPE